MKCFNRKSYGMVLLPALAWLAAALPGDAKTQGMDCSSLVVNHSYSQEFAGFVNVPIYFQAIGMPAPFDELVPSAGTGFLTFLHGGKVAGQVTLAVGKLGLTQDIVFDDLSSYALSWDTSKTPAVCAGEATLHGTATGGPPYVFHFLVFVSSQGDYIDMIHGDPGLIVGMRGFPVETRGCNQNTLTGKYAHNMNGWVLSQQGSPTLAGYVPFAFSGITQFQSHRLAPPGHTGAVAWWNTGSDNGTIENRSGTGWYDLTSDCKGTMALQDSSGGELNLQFFVGKDGNALYLVNTDTIPLPPPAPAIPAFVLGMTANRIEQD